MGEQAERFAAARVAHLATVTPGGAPHVVPCCFVLDGDVVFTAVDAKPKSTVALQRIANVRTNPATTLLVDHYDDAAWDRLWWIRVDGTARVLESGPDRERALDLLAAKYPQYREQRPPGAVIAIDITTWRSWP